MVKALGLKAALSSLQTIAVFIITKNVLNEVKSLNTKLQKLIKSLSAKLQKLRASVQSTRS